MAIAWFLMSMTLALVACSGPLGDGNPSAVAHGKGHLTTARSHESDPASSEVGVSDGDTEQLVKNIRKMAAFVQSCTETPGHDKGNFVDGNSQFTETPCAMSQLATTNFKTINRDASLWQAINIFSPPISETAMCRQANGETAPCYQQESTKANPNVLISNEAALKYITARHEHDHDAVILSGTGGKQYTTLTFDQVKNALPYKIYLQDYPKIQIQRPGIAVRIWRSKGMIGTDSVLSRCVDAPIDGRSTTVTRHTALGIIEDFAEISTVPCDNHDGSLANVNFVYESGERHFLNPCYKNIEGSWYCAFSPEWVRKMEPVSYESHAKAVATLAKIDSTIVTLAAFSLGFETGAALINVSKRVATALGRALMMGGLYSVYGSYTNYANCRQHTTGDCFDEKLDLGVNLVVNAVFVVEAIHSKMSSTPNEYAIEARANLADQLRSVWGPEEASRATTAFVASYPWVNQISDDVLADFVGVLAAHFDGLTDERLGELDHVKADEDLAKVTQKLKTEASDEELTTPPTKPDDAGATDGDTDEESDDETCFEDGDGRRLGSVFEEMSMYNSTNIFAHPKASLAEYAADILGYIVEPPIKAFPPTPIADIPRAMMIGTILLATRDAPARIELDGTENLEATYRESMVRSEWFRTLLPYISDVLASSFYEGTFDHFDIVSGIESIRAVLGVGFQGRYTEKPRTSVDDLQLDYVPQSANIESRGDGLAYGMVTEVDRAVVNYLPGVILARYGDSLSGTTGLEAGQLADAPVVNEDAPHRIRVTTHVKFTKDFRYRLGLVSLVQMLMEPNVAQVAIQRLFDPRLRGRGYIENATLDGFEVLAPLVGTDSFIREHPVWTLAEHNYLQAKERNGLEPKDLERSGATADFRDDLKEYMLRRGLPLGRCAGSARRLRADYDGDGTFLRFHRLLAFGPSITPAALCAWRGGRVAR